MANSAEEKFRKIQDNLANTLRDLPAIIGNEAVNFSLESFEQEAWSGNSQEVWPKRKDPTKWGKRDDGHALLVKSGKLKRSIRVSKIEEDKVTVTAGGADIPYAKVHNEGFSGTVTQEVGEHTRKDKLGKLHKVSAFQRIIQQRIPKRKFIGGEKDSPYLKARIRRAVILELRKTFKQ